MSARKATPDPLIIGGPGGAGVYCEVRLESSQGPESSGRRKVSDWTVIFDRGPGAVLPISGDPAQFDPELFRFRFTAKAGQTIARWLTEHLRPRARVRLASTGDVARLGKVSNKTVHNWRNAELARPFPAPIDDTAAGPIWNRDEVEAWLKHDRPAKGPRRKV